MAALRHAVANPRPPTAHSHTSSEQSTPTNSIQTFDDRKQLIVHPSQIKPGDWLNDIGTLRQVESVDALSVMAGSGMIHILHFKDQPGIANKALGFSTRANAVTIWRKQ